MIRWHVNPSDYRGLGPRVGALEIWGHDAREVSPRNGPNGTYIRAFPDLINNGAVEGTRVSNETSCNVVGVPEASQGININVENTLAAADPDHGNLASFPERCERRLVNTSNPEMVLCSGYIVHMLLEDYDIVVGDFILGRGARGEQRGFVDDSIVVDGECNRGRDRSKQREFGREMHGVKVKLGWLC